MLKKLTLLAAIAPLAIGCGTANADTTPESELTALEIAVEDCGPRSSSPAGAEFYKHVVLGDEGQTLTVIGKGSESDGVTITDIACILSALDASDAVIAQMSSTRALDGRQEGSWAGFTASWTYHPNSGFNLIVQAS